MYSFHLKHFLTHWILLLWNTDISMPSHRMKEIVETVKIQSVFGKFIWLLKGDRLSWYPIKCTMITCICFHCDCLVSDSPASKCRSCCVRGTSKHKSVPAGNKWKNKLCLKSISIKTNHCINATENMPPTQDGDHTLIMSRRLLWNYVSLSNLIVQCRWKTHQSQRQNR